MCTLLTDDTDVAVLHKARVAGADSPGVADALLHAALAVLTREVVTQAWRGG